MEARIKQALTGIKVLDFGWALAGSLTTKHLADHGAQVVRVESINRPDLTRTSRLISRSKANNPDDKPWFTYVNTSKYSISLNLKHPKAKGVTDKLIRWADVINENFTPGTMDKLGLGYEYVRTIKPDIVMLGASVYGQTGPHSRTWGVDGTGTSLSGHRNLTGWSDRWPVASTTAPYGDILLPFFSALAIVSALDYRRRTGKGQYIDASMLEVLIHDTVPALLDWEFNGHLQIRIGNRITYAAPHGVFPCIGEDRWCAIAVFTEQEWRAFCNILGNPPWTTEARFETLELRKANENALEEFVADWTKKHSAEDVMYKMQNAGVAAGVVQNVQDLLENDPQLKEREFMIQLEHPVIGTFSHPTPAYKLLKTKAQMRTSPCFGEHTEFVCKQLLGMSDDEFIDLLQEEQLFI